MPEIEIRPVTVSDLNDLIGLDHNYASDFVWQMEINREERQVQMTFREVRLPRSVQVKYPRDPLTLADDWSRRDCILVASMGEEIVGYICLVQNMAPDATWATDLVVLRRVRRQGIGSALVLAAQEWARENDSLRLILEMQPKNYPAIQLAHKLGFELCGYNDHYYANHDIALFFSNWVR
jgi:GNAT superfamily N-acetyltransferase